MTLQKSILVAGLLALTLGPTAWGQQEPISAERPGFSSSPFALAPGSLQIEGGYQFTQDDNGTDVESHTLPLALFRWGLAEKVELQLGWAGQTWLDVNGNSVNGTSDLSIGLKRQFGDENSLVPIALFLGFSVPVGDDEFTSDSVDPTLGLFWTHDAGLDWFGTVLVSEIDSNTILSNAVGISFPVNERTGGYIEYFAEFPDRGDSRHTLNSGIAWLSRIDLQFDVHAGVGINDEAPDLFIGAGAAFRY